MNEDVQPATEQIHALQIGQESGKNDMQSKEAKLLPGGSKLVVRAQRHPGSEREGQIEDQVAGSIQAELNPLVIHLRASRVH